MKENRFLGGILLVVGTCIGAGMIGVPVKTAAAGFFPTLVSFGIIWVVMTISALLFLEVSLCFPGETNFISMAQATFGRSGKVIAWVANLFYMYLMMAAYTSGGVTLISELFPIPIHMYLLLFIYLFPFALSIYLGAKWVDLVNRFLTIGLIISFTSLCISTLFSAHTLQPLSNLTTVGSVHILVLALPLLVATFAYHVIIPSLKTYLEENVVTLKRIILIGSAIPLVIYIIWQLVIILLVPVFGDESLVNMLSANKNPGDSIHNYLLKYNKNIWVLASFSGFVFCALTSSLMGVGWSLGDFFADGFNIVKNKVGKLILIFLTFVPPVVYTLMFPQGFLKALVWAGLCSTIIMIIYPALMAYKLRIATVSNTSVKYKVPINKTLITIIVLFGSLVIILEFMNQLNLI